MAVTGGYSLMGGGWQLQKVCERTYKDMLGSNKREVIFGWRKLHSHCSLNMARNSYNESQQDALFLNSIW